MRNGITFRKSEDEKIPDAWHSQGRLQEELTLEVMELKSVNKLSRFMGCCFGEEREARILSSLTRVGDCFRWAGRWFSSQYIVFGFILWILGNNRSKHGLCINCRFQKINLLVLFRMYWREGNLEAGRLVEILNKSWSDMKEGTH